MNIQDYKDAEALVGSVLRDWPQTRNDDRLLFLKVWDMQGFKLTPEQRTFFRNKCMTPETITRARRFWQNEKIMYRATPKVEEQRSLMQEDFRKHFQK